MARRLLEVTGPESRSSSARHQTVTSTAAALVLTRADRRRFLEPFVGRELSPAEAARELGVAVEDMAYRVRALRAAGLLVPTRTESRAGRPVTHYRAATEIRASVALLPRADTRALLDTVDAGGRTAFLDALAAGADRWGLRDWTVRLQRTPGGIRLDLVPDREGWAPDTLLGEGAPAVLLHWAPLALSAQRAKELQRELTAVLERYTGEPGGPPTHLLGLALTPLGR